MGQRMSYELAGILITVVLQALYIAFKIGKFEEKLNTLEKKQDKHNNLIERMIRVEDSTKSAHRRMDNLEQALEIAQVRRKSEMN